MSERPSCPECGAAPDAAGWITHSTHCRRVDAAGGGRSFVAPLQDNWPWYVVLEDRTVIQLYAPDAESAIVGGRQRALQDRNNASPVTCVVRADALSLLREIALR